MDASPVCVVSPSQNSAPWYPYWYLGAMPYVLAAPPDISLPGVDAFSAAQDYYPVPAHVNLTPNQENGGLPGGDDGFLQPFVPIARPSVQHLAPFWQQVPSIQQQQFDYFVVIDFEATCNADRPPFPQEIIEFPSVIVSAVTGQVVSEFRTYVRPKYNPGLSDFCKELTGLQQADVDGGVGLKQAIEMHDNWLEYCGVKHANFAVVTWGDWDCRSMLESECLFKGVEKPAYFDRWINLQAVFSQITGRHRKTKLRNAVEEAGLTWEGRQHCGLDDARNTGRLLVSLMACGFAFSITSSLLSEDGNGTSITPGYSSVTP